jgi:hypothetical protein
MLLLAGALAAGFGLWTPLSIALFLTDPSLPNAVQSGVQRSLPPWFWNPLFSEILSWPSWVFPLVIGLFSWLLTIGRPSPRG